MSLEMWKNRGVCAFYMYIFTSGLAYFLLLYDYFSHYFFTFKGRGWRKAPPSTPLLAGMGGASGGCGGTTYPPLLRPVPRRGYNPIYVVYLRGTTAGRAATVTQFTFGFSTWKFC